MLVVVILVLGWGCYCVVNVVSVIAFECIVGLLWLVDLYNSIGRF